MSFVQILHTDLITNTDGVPLYIYVYNIEIIIERSVCFLRCLKKISKYYVGVEILQGSKAKNLKQR
jgi:hypothetical protein